MLYWAIYKKKYFLYSELWFSLSYRLSCLVYFLNCIYVHGVESALDVYNDYSFKYRQRGNHKYFHIPKQVSVEVREVTLVLFWKTKILYRLLLGVDHKAMEHLMSDSMRLK